MDNGISFTGNGEADISARIPTSTHEKASRGAQGPISFSGNGDMDVGGTLGSTEVNGEMPPKGSGVEFTGDLGAP